MTLSTHHPWNIRIRNENTTEFPSQFIDDRCPSLFSIKSARRALNKKKMYFEFFSGLLCEAKNVNLGEFGVYDIDVSQGQYLNPPYKFFKLSSNDSQKCLKSG